MPADITNSRLSAGILIGRYEIREVLGIGGFGITYKARDTKLNRLVAIKEYLPADTAVRAHNSSTVHAHESRADEYQYGLERFLDEAKTLARFHHPNIIAVLDHLELNNTAYLVMTYEQGQTLSQHLNQHGGKLPELELKAIVKSILTGLQHIHEQDCYHRDIKPSNIYIRKQGEPVLIDFGAARQAIGTRSRSLTNFVSAGYTPSEQYGSNQSKQGAWSDLYAVGAIMYRSISGEKPSDAATRSSDIMEGDPDPLIPATKIGRGRYTEELLQLIDWMLAPAIKNRPHNATEVLIRLEQNSESEDLRNTEATRLKEEVSSTDTTMRVTGKRQPTKTAQTNNPAGRYTSSPVTETSPPPKSRRWLVLGSLGLLMLAGIGISQKETLKQQQTEKQQTIQTLPSGAAVNIKQLRLSSPKGNNAVEKYQQVLQLEADNHQAQQGFKTIIDKYLKMAALSQQRNDYAKAARQLQKAATINADDPALAQAEQDLNTAQQAHAAEQQQIADEAARQAEQEAEQEAQARKKTEQAAAAKKRANSAGIAMVRITPGCFQMGSNGHDREKPIHRVCLTQSYEIGKYEVTQAQWQKVMGNNPSHFKGSNKPVEKVSWNDVQSFIRKLNQQSGQNYRLPTEAEWEYACRSGGKNQQYCGSNNAGSVAWYDSNSGSTTHNVGQKQPNGLGLYDMSGNALEWVQDWYSGGYYNNSPVNNPKGPSGGSYRVYRGGSWILSASYARSADRYYLSPGNRSYNLGLRLVRTR